MSDFEAPDVPDPSGDAFIALDDYTSGALSDAEAEAFETELFARAARGEAPEAELAERLRRAAEWVGRRGGFKAGSTRAEVDALLASGLHVVLAEFGDATKPVEIPAFPPDLDLYIYRVDVDVRGYTNVDVVVETEDGRHIKTFRDLSCDPADGSLYGVCEAPLARMAFGHRLFWKLMVGRGAERRHLRTLETRPAPA
jgi:hypothetical protein